MFYSLPELALLSIVGLNLLFSSLKIAGFTKGQEVKAAT